MSGKTAAGGRFVGTEGGGGAIERGGELMAAHQISFCITMKKKASPNYAKHDW